MTVRAAYDATGAAWEAGPARIYDHLAEVLVARCPGGVVSRRVLDLGAGTGAATRAALAAGAAEVVASDLSIGMLASGRLPACTADALALPFADGAFGAVVAAFSLNHIPTPVPALAEAARVLASGGGLAASAYAEDDTHPVKGVVEQVLAARGWAPEPWYLEVKADAVPQLATPERAAAAMAAAGLTGAVTDRVREPLPALSPADLVAWRLGMAQNAGFVGALTPAVRAEIEADALALLGPNPPELVRSFVVATWQKR